MTAHPPFRACHAAAPVIAWRLPLIVVGLGLSAAAQAQHDMPAVHLPTVTVPGTAPEETATGPVSGFVARRAATATKTDTAVLDTPQSITVITQNRITRQGAQSVLQAAGYSGGVSAADSFGADNRSDWIQIRGAKSSQYLDGLLNAVGFYNNTRPDPYALERVDILRGPPGMLYGQASSSGIVNVVSKRPQPEAAREIDVSVGSHDRKQIQEDLTDPLDAVGTWLYRLVALGRDSGSAVMHASWCAV